MVCQTQKKTEIILLWSEIFFFFCIGYQENATTLEELLQNKQEALEAQTVGFTAT